MSDDPIILPDEDLPEELGEVVVMSHVHDEEVGIYIIVTGQQYVRGYEVTRTEELRDYVFADDDDRWKDSSGNFLSDLEIANAQRELIRVAMAEISEINPVAQHRALPGVGEAL
jgi:hypothetical protein